MQRQLRDHGSPFAFIALKMRCEPNVAFCLLWLNCTRFPTLPATIHKTRAGTSTFFPPNLAFLSTNCG